jgi:hypothetical protein
MIYGIFGQVVLFIPFAGSAMEYGLKASLGLMQSLPQQIGKEMVIAVPSSLVV